MTPVVSPLIDKIRALITPSARFIQQRVNSRSVLMLQCAALFLIVVGARFWLIGNYGSDLPFWDQWDAEASGIIKPYYNGVLTIQHWFAPHNEHRVFFSRLVSYALLVLNGQWDARVQMVFNSLFYTLFGCGLFLLFAVKRSPLFGLFWSIVLAAFFSCPFGWENTLAGFQSQFYFLAAFSLTSIWLIINKPSWSYGWGAGVALGFCSLFTMGSGLLAPLAVLWFVCMTLTREWRDRCEVVRRMWPTVVFCFLIIVMGALLSTQVEEHSAYRAHGVADFTNALVSCLAWPWMQHRWWAAVCWLPAVFLVGGYLIRRLPDIPDVRFLTAVTAWAVFQAAATAYSRSAVILAPRYSDVLCFGFLFNILCACTLLRNRRCSVQGALWVILIAVSLAVNGLRMYRLGFNGEFEHRKKMYDMEKYRTSGFMATGNFSYMVLANGQESLQIPYPVAGRLVGLLKDPVLEPILPVSVRMPLKVSGISAGTLFLSDKFSFKSISPYPWEKLRMLPVNSFMPYTMNYSVTKSQGLPFLHLYLNGAVSNLQVIDSKNSGHNPVALSGTDGHWQEVYVYCPGRECRFAYAGNSDKKILFSEPKEMGLLSLAAVLVTGNSNLFMFTGLFGFFCIAVVCVLKLKWWISSQSAECSY